MSDSDPALMETCTSLEDNISKQVYIPIEKMIKQSASTSSQCNTSRNRHQPATYHSDILAMYYNLPI